MPTKETVYFRYSPMQVLRTIPYVFFPAAIILIIPLIMGLSDEFKSFGVRGKVLFEDASSKGALVIFTTSDQNPFNKEINKGLYFEQYLQESGYFYRKINESGGEDINIWIKQKGYPIVQVTRVLDTSEDYIDFNRIQIPAKLKTVNPYPIEFFKAPCENKPIISVLPEEVAAVRNFNSLRCEDSNKVQFEARIDLVKGALKEAKSSVVLYSSKLANVVF